VFGLERRFTPVFESQGGKPRLDQLLHSWCQFGDRDIVRLLVDRGADVSSADADGKTPLHIASERDHEAVARLLVDWGADVSSADKYGRTPLHIASERGHGAVARLLVDRGADVSSADKYGRTPLHIASE